MHTLSQPEESWKGEKGRITKEMIQKSCPAPSKETIILFCGSSDFKNKSIIPKLQELGYNMENTFGY